MKRIPILSALLCLSASIALTAAPSSVAKIEEATVYYKDATLSYTATAQLEKGAGTLEITGLSPSIDRSSLKVKAGSGVLISAAEFSAGRFQDPEAMKLLAAMRDSLTLLQKQILERANRISIQEKLLSLLTDGVENNLKGRSSGSTATEITANLELYRKNAENYYKNLDAERANYEKLSGEETALEARIRETEKIADKGCGILKLTYSAPAAGEVPFTISYYTSAARWPPIYEVNVADIDQPVILTAKGQVRQSTGLDWKQLRLRLSSGQPDRTNVAPVMSSWKLGFKQVRGNQIVLAKSAAREVALVEEAVAESATMDTYVEVAEAGLETCYEIALPYDIAGDGSLAGIDLKTYEMPAKFEHFTAPRLSTDVFLTAQISNWDSYKLLPGQATVTYAGAYVGNTTLDKAAKDGSLRLTLGVDPNVQVTRERAEEMKAPAVLVGKTTVSIAWRTFIIPELTKPTVMTLVAEDD